MSYAEQMKERMAKNSPKSVEEKSDHPKPLESLGKAVSDAAGAVTGAVVGAAAAAYDVSPMKLLYEMELAHWKVWTQFIKDVGSLITDLKDFITNMVDLTRGSKDFIEELKNIMVPFGALKPVLEKMDEAVKDVNNLDLKDVLNGPNLDTAAAQELSRMLAIPYFGSVLKNQIDLAWLDRYQKLIHRGFPTALDELHYLASGGITPVNMINEIESKLPNFMLDNTNPRPSMFDKGFKEGLKAAKANKATAAALKLIKPL